MNSPPSLANGGLGRAEVLPAARFNPWPYGIVATLILFVLGIAALILVSRADRTDLVAADYYEQEIRYQKRLEQLRRTGPWEEHIGVGFEPGTRQVQIRLPQEHAAVGAQGSIRFYRPSRAILDREVELSVDTQGQQSVAAADLPAGLWKVRLMWKVGADEFFAERPLVVPPTPRM